MTDADTLAGLTPGLYFDESGRTLAEVTAALAACLEDQGLYSPDEEDRATLAGITQDETSGLFHSPDYEAVGWVYEALEDIITENTAEDLYWGYLNEGGGWGLWSIEEEWL